MKLKKLKIINPPIKVQMMYSYHLTVTLINEKTHPWFYSNFIQLKCYPSDLISNRTNSIKFFQGKVNFNPWLKSNPKITESKNIINDVIDSINNNCYVECPVDEYFIPKMRFGKIRHYFHRVLIYGYDLSKEELNVIGYKNNHIYGTTTCTFNEFTEAFHSEAPENWNHKEEIKKFAVPEIDFEYSIDQKRIILLLDDYIKGVNSYGPEQESDITKNIPWYGVNVYKFLYQSLELLLNGKGKLDLRAYQALSEHKNIMLQRIKYLTKNRYLGTCYIKEYGEIKMIAEYILNLAIKFRINKSESALLNIKHSIYSLKEMEINILKKLKAELESNFIVKR